MYVVEDPVEFERFLKLRYASRRLSHLAGQAYYGSSDFQGVWIEQEIDALKADPTHWFPTPPATGGRLDFVSVIGGLYALNLITLLRPAEATLFDINPFAVFLFTTLRNCVMESDSEEDYLRRLRTQRYPVRCEFERKMQVNISRRARGERIGRCRVALHECWFVLRQFDRFKKAVCTTPTTLVFSDVADTKLMSLLGQKDYYWLHLSNIDDYFTTIFRRKLGVTEPASGVRPRIRERLQEHVVISSGSNIYRRTADWPAIAQTATVA